jgi:aspartate racemase
MKATAGIGCIGLIGGVGWLSTADYYRIINEEVGRRLGGLHSARIVMVSLDFAQVRSHVDAGEEHALVELYADAAQKLEQAGAEVLALCSNAAHGRIGQLQPRVGVPFLHIADAVGAAARAAGMRHVGLLGTRETMERPFMRDGLAQRAGLRVSVPGVDDRDWLHGMIFGALEQGRATDADRDKLLAIIERLADAGAEAVVLGCTELPLLLRGVDTPIPCLDSTLLHATALVESAININQERTIA